MKTDLCARTVELCARPYCQRQGRIHFDGASYCSQGCLTEAMNAERCAPFEARERMEAARQQRGQLSALMSAGLLALLLCCLLIPSMDRPAPSPDWQGEKLVARLAP